MISELHVEYLAWRRLTHPAYFVADLSFASDKEVLRSCMVLIYSNLRPLSCEAKERADQRSGVGVS